MRVSTQWDKVASVHQSLEILKKLALAHAERAGQSGKAILQLITANDYVGLVHYELDYETLDPEDAYHCRQALGFFQKLEDLDIGVDKEQVAYKKFIESEERCKVTNQVFRLFAGENRGICHTSPDAIAIFHRARRKIKQILGPVPSLADLKPRFGPGSTSTLRRRKASACNKLADGIKCSYNLYVNPILPGLLREIPHWTSAQESSWSIDDDGFLCEHVNVTVEPGVLEFVPKNAKTYRTITKPTSLNGFFQLGVGDYLAKRLKRFNIDISDQAPNQRAAKRGSIDGSLATIDLSSASDMIATELVRFLLPEDWFHLLSALREDTVVYKGTEIFLEKFSGMGNGFTFPLETLIFWCLAWGATSDPDLLTYGDDIVCRTENAPAIIRVLSQAGFVVNESKSCVSGPFRESCGKDYLSGIDIRPYYQKELVSGRTLFTLHNYYYRSWRREFCPLVRSFIPLECRIFGPDGYGDGHLLGDWQPKLCKKLQRKGYGGVKFETFSLCAVFEPNIYHGDWVSPLYHIYMGSPPNCEIMSRIGCSEPSLRFTKTGRPLWSVPGSKGYARMSIYTFDR